VPPATAAARTLTAKKSVMTDLIGRP
jgi:hypothetical protein